MISVLMLVHSGAVMFDSWQTVKQFNECVNDAYSIEGVNPELASILSELKYQDCKESLNDITGAQITAGSKYLTSRQFWTAFIAPVTVFLGWAIVFLFALFLFNNTAVVVPVQQVEIDLKNKKKINKKKNNKKNKK